MLYFGNAVRWDVKVVSFTNSKSHMAAVAFSWELKVMTMNGLEPHMPLFCVIQNGSFWSQLR